MFSQLKSITISGGGFPAEQYPKGVTLDIFEYRMNLIYGKNGSGKSTIASAIRDWKEGRPSDVSLTFSPALPDNAKQSVFVFNEDFIRENILTKARGPETIMMIGADNVSATTKIGTLQADIEELENKAKPINDRIALLEAAKGQDSKDAAMKAVFDILKADGGYAERATLVKNHQNSLGGRNKARVGESEIDLISSTATPTALSKYPLTKNGLADYLKEKINLLSSAKGGQSKVYWNAPSLNTGIDAESLNGLLEHTVIKPQLSEREKAIFSMLEDSAVTAYVRQTKRDIIDAKAGFCPLCHQPIGHEAMVSLETAVTRLLSDEENIFATRIIEAAHGLTNISFNPPYFPDGMYAGDISACQSALFKLNGITDNVRSALISRQNDIYSACSFRIDEQQYFEAVEAAASSFKKLEADVAEYNNMLDNAAAIQKDAETVNCLLAYLEAKTQIDTFIGLRDELNDKRNEVNDINRQITDKDSEIGRLGQQMRQTGTAHDYINKQLRNIFYSGDRLSLKGEENGSYIVCSRGKAVPPGKLSTGERNIIALTYFFATLFSGKTESKKYSSPMLIIIDDPVSSFDSGNRAGISAFLSFELEKILKGNKDDSKVLVFSHDIHTVNDLSKISSFNPDDAPVFREMRDGKLQDIKGRDNEYWKMLRDIFDYAAGYDVPESEETAIGNKMRRVLETYSTFMYQCGFKDMFDQRHNYVCDTLPTDRRDYYRAFLGRFILDASSHSNNQVNTLDFTESLYSREEKLANARNLLTFMYWSNPTHLKAYLQCKNKDLFGIVEQWALREE